LAIDDLCGVHGVNVQPACANVYRTGAIAVAARRADREGGKQQHGARNEQIGDVAFSFGSAGATSWLTGGGEAG